MHRNRHNVVADGLIIFYDHIIISNPCTDERSASRYLIRQLARVDLWVFGPLLAKLAGLPSMKQLCQEPG